MKLSNPFAKVNVEAAKVEPGYVKVILSNMLATKNGDIRGTKVRNGITEFGTKFSVVKNVGGSFGLVGKVEQAQGMCFVVADGTKVDISEQLIGQTLNIRLTEEELNDLIDECEGVEGGIGISVCFSAITGLVNIRKLTYADGSLYNSYSIVGTLVEQEIEPAYSSLTSDVLSLEDLHSYFTESSKANVEALETARSMNLAAREAGTSVKDLKSLSIKRR